MALSDANTTLIPHAASIDAVLAALGADKQRGLTAQEVAERLRRDGPNELTEAPPPPWWLKLAKQFRSLVVWILIVAAVIAGVMGEAADTVAILAIVVLNGVLGFMQEERAERALRTLKSLSSPAARVLRDGTLAALPARELVCGDTILLEAGDLVPADARLIEAFALQAQEAALTGESTPVDKSAAEVFPADTPLADRRNSVYLGTTIGAGKATAVVTATGMRSELGHIAGMLQRYEPEPTPLEVRLQELGRVLIVVCGVLVAIIFTLQLLRGGEVLKVLLTAVSLAVAAVPEGLPAVVTVALALGLQRMVKRNALVRKLPSVETLGSVTVICSDKTGTLTRNEMTVRELVAGGRRYRVSGVGYDPKGEFLADEATRVEPAREPDLLQALAVAARCNSAHVVPRADGVGHWELIGDPTEGALLVAAMKAGISRSDATWQVLHEIPFDSQRKAMSIVLPADDGAVVMYTKGAPEVVLACCASELVEGKPRPLTPERRQAILQENRRMADAALRVLALAYRTWPGHDGAVYEERELVLAGLAGMVDPPRQEAKTAVARCRRAGIRPVMITGDHPATAAAIARELDMLAPEDRVVSGRDLDQLDDASLIGLVEHVAVYARVSAEHKLRVVRAWKGRGQVVAMTGDGVNDAPAVKAADIGIAMGVTGTDVTKEASDMVLTDDNFASIVNAVEEGRGIFDNIQKFVHYLLSTNAGEVLTMFVAALVGWPSPLLPIQLLWINLVTDGLPALALGMEPPEPGIMDRPPRPPREPVITVRRGLLIAAHGTLVGACIIAGFGWVYWHSGGNAKEARTAAFCVAAFTQLFFAFGCRSQRYTMPQLGPFSNPMIFVAIAASSALQLAVVSLSFTRDIFRTVPLPLAHWAVIAALSLTPATVIELAKIIRLRWKRT